MARNSSPATRGSVKSKCKGCNKNVPANSESLQCDHCTEWWHRDCGQVFQKDYSYLKDNPQTTMKWFCDSCKDQMKNNANGHSAQCDGKIDNLTKIIQTMQEQQQTMQNQQQTMQEQMNTMQTQMALVLEMIKKDQNEGPIELDKKIEVKVVEMIDEDREIQEKRNNMIVYNIEEAPDSEEDGKELKDDIEKVREVLSVVHPDASKISLTDVTVTRCGFNKKKDKMRPIRVKLMENSTKGVIFKNSWKLKEHDKFKKVGLSNDKTAREQLKDRELRSRLQDKKKETGEDDWIIYRDNIIKRSAKPQRNHNNGSPSGKH